MRLSCRPWLSSKSHVVWYFRYLYLVWLSTNFSLDSIAPWKCRPSYFNTRSIPTSEKLNKSTFASLECFFHPNLTTFRACFSVLGLNMNICTCLLFIILVTSLQRSTWAYMWPLVWSGPHPESQNDGTEEGSYIYPRNTQENRVNDTVRNANIVSIKYIYFKSGWVGFIIHVLFISCYSVHISNYSVLQVKPQNTPPPPNVNSSNLRLACD